MLLGEPSQPWTVSCARELRRAHAREGSDPALLLSTWFAETAGGVDDLKPRLLRVPGGHLVPLDVARWSGPVDDADQTLLSRSCGAVLDVGCGPGRLTVALHARGIDVMGLELVGSIPVLARAAGAPFQVGDVFGEVPRAGEWDVVLLADGNVGIGGDPVRLLRRAAALIDPAGRVLVELHAGPEPAPGLVRLEGLGATSAWFRWATLGSSAVAATAGAAGLAVHETWSSHGREFAELVRD